MFVRSDNGIRIESDDNSRNKTGQTGDEHHSVVPLFFSLPESWNSMKWYQIYEPEGKILVHNSRIKKGENIKPVSRHANLEGSPSKCWTERLRRSYFRERFDSTWSEYGIAHNEALPSIKFNRSHCQGFENNLAVEQPAETASTVFLADERRQKVNYFVVGTRFIFWRDSGCDGNFQIRSAPVEICELTWFCWRVIRL